MWLALGEYFTIMCTLVHTQTSLQCYNVLLCHHVHASTYTDILDITTMLQRITMSSSVH